MERTTRRRAVGASAAAALILGLLPQAAAAQDRGSAWPVWHGDGQNSRQGVAVGPVTPGAKWAWSDDRYVADGGLGGTRTTIPGVLDGDGRLLFKSRNTDFDDLPDEPARHDLLALDPEGGSAQVLLTDVNDDHCPPGVAPDGTIWTFQEINERTETRYAHGDNAAAWLVAIDPDTGDVEHRYSGGGAGVAGIFGCAGGVQFGTDGAVVFKDTPAAGGILDGTFTPWVRAMEPDGTVRFEEYFDPDDTGRIYRYPWLLIAPEDTPGEGVAYLGYHTDDDDETLGLAAIDLDDGTIVRSIELPSSSFGFLTTPVVDPDGGIVLSLEGAAGDDAQHVMRVTDDGVDLEVDWQQRIVEDRDRTGALKGALRSLQVAGDRIVGWSDATDVVSSFAWADGEFHWNHAAGFRNSEQIAVDAAGNAYIASLSSGQDDATAIKVISPNGTLAGRMLKGSVADVNGGDTVGFRTVGPLADDGTLYLWGSGNTWVAVEDRPEACPEQVVPSAGFTDVSDGYTHAAAIDCLAWWQLARGFRDGTYGPTSAVTRGQMASFIANLLDAADVTLPASPPDAFDDDDGSVHERPINQLTALGVVNGRGPGRYDPGHDVTRAQTASLLVRAYEVAAGQPLPTGPDAFGDDDGNTHEANINAAAAAGITNGSTPTTFDPGGATNRGQMASLLTRMLDRLVTESIATRPGG